MDITKPMHECPVQPVLQMVQDSGKTLLPENATLQVDTPLRNRTQDDRGA